MFEDFDYWWRQNETAIKFVGWLGSVFLALMVLGVLAESIALRPEQLQRQYTDVHLVAMDLVKDMEHLPEHQKAGLKVGQLRSILSQQQQVAPLTTGTAAHASRTLDTMERWFRPHKGKKLPQKAEYARHGLGLLKHRMIYLSRKEEISRAQ